MKVLVKTGKNDILRKLKVRAGFMGGMAIFHNEIAMLKRSSYVTGCSSVQEGNPRALVSGLSPVEAQNHTITFLLHQHIFSLCALRCI